MFELPERISIDIPQPCDQSWDAMSPSEKGRFCEQCSRHLIDFRDKTDKEIAEIHLTSWGKVCGVYLPEQLTPRTTPLKRRWAGVYWGALGLLAAGSANAQSPKLPIYDHPIEQDQFGYDMCPLPLPETPKEQVTEPHAPSSTLIKLRVVDATDEPIPFATVLLDDFPDKGWVTDFNGEVDIRPDSVLTGSSEFDLTVRYVGHNDTRLEDVRFVDSATTVVEITMPTFDLMIFGYAVTVKRPIHKRIWWKAKGLFRKRH